MRPYKTAQPGGNTPAKKDPKGHPNKYNQQTMNTLTQNPKPLKISGTTIGITLTEETPQ